MYSFKSLQRLFITQLEKESELIGLLEPVNLYEPVLYTLGMGGKRLRPIMTLMACDLFGGKIDEAMNAALAIEIFHNFTLLHDDIMDKAAMRRNMPSVHTKYSPNTAILSGDAMSIMAYRYLLKTGGPALHDIVGLFTETAIQVCEGQQYDMDFEQRFDVSIGDYLKMIRMKTAVLIGCSFKTGALIGGASNVDAQNIYNFGINLGLAFQLQDDLLDVYADPDKFGKKNGGDIAANKKTFLLLKALEIASQGQNKELMTWISRKIFNLEEKISAVKSIYNELNISTLTKNSIEGFYRAALDELESVQVESKRREELLLLAESIMRREF